MTDAGDADATPLAAEIGKGGLASRALGGSALSVIGFGGTQMMRLASNLILTRLLSPEDFGLMTLVTSFLIGLMMFSDVGLGPSIQQSQRGDDPAFLDTAWTIKVIRGAGLLLAAVVIAVPLSHVYSSPEFAHIFPVAAISLLIAGFNPTRIDTAARHLFLGRLTVIELAAQAINIIITIVFALWLQSVWALAIGNVTAAIVLLVLSHLYLPGHVNRFRMEPAARSELVHFGKWIFLSTIFGFLQFQGDRVILGRVLTLDQLGIYNIGLFLGTVPITVGAAIGNRLFIPMYRQHPPSRSAADFRMLSKTKGGVSAFLIVLVVILALGGPWIVEALYDHRYIAAGWLLVLMALLQLPQIAMLGYDHAALAAGDTRRMFIVQAIRSIIYISFIGAGAWLFGLTGLLIGQAIAFLLAFPPTIWLARQHGAWNARQDMAVLAASALLTALVFWLHGAEIATALATMG